MQPRIDPARAARINFVCPYVVGVVYAAGLIVIFRIGDRL